MPRNLSVSPTAYITWSSNFPPNAQLNKGAGFVLRPSLTVELLNDSKFRGLTQLKMEALAYANAATQPERMSVGRV